MDLTRARKRFHLGTELDSDGIFDDLSDNRETLVKMPNPRIKSIIKDGVKPAGFQLVTSTPLRELKNVDTESWPSPILPFRSKSDKKQVSKFPVLSQVQRNVKEITPAVKEITPAVKEITPAVKEITPAVKVITTEVQEMEQRNYKKQRFVFLTHKSRSKNVESDTKHKSNRRSEHVTETATKKMKSAIPLAVRYVEGSSFSSGRKQNKQTLKDSVHIKTSKQLQGKERGLKTVVEKDRNLQTLETSSDDEDNRQEENVRIVNKQHNSKENKSNKQVKNMTSKLYNDIGKVSIVSSSDEDDFDTVKKLSSQQSKLQTNKDIHIRKSPRTLQASPVLTKVKKRTQGKTKKEVVQKSSGKIGSKRISENVSLLETMDEEDEFDILATLSPKVGVKLTAARDSEGHTRQQEQINHVAKEHDKQLAGKVDAGMPSTSNAKIKCRSTRLREIINNLANEWDSEGHTSQQEKINHVAKERDKQLASNVDVDTPSTRSSDKKQNRGSTKQQNKKTDHVSKVRDEELPRNEVETPSTTSSGRKQNRGSTKQQNKKTDHVSKVRDDELPRNEGQRHSKRKRVRPLEYWRGERIVYEQCPDLCYKIVDIAPGRYEHPWWAPKPSKHRVTSQERRLSSDVIDDTVAIPARKLITVPTTEGECELECFSTSRSGDTNVTFGGNMKIYTNIEVPGIMFGKIEIFPHGRQTLSRNDNNLVFYVVSGKLNVTIHKTNELVSKGESFFVPRGVKYQLKNTTNNSVFLTFTMCE